ncbi:MAG: CoB--CoM heterodisulfide reductase iron-sulfur subunit B family protein [Candidatus Hatepunaea meridiana]|nr:CoB--CoM heterodisulfide reductase iron-sulfur subunit B family protein [Candidatus Hatepunaea meridiana]
MKIGYYPGCTLKTKALNLEQAAIQSMAALGVEMVELDRWNCCGAVYSLADDDLIHILAPVRDLIRAKDQGYNKIVVLCSMCYNTLARANLLMRNDEVKRKTINDFLEEENDYAGEVEVVHLLNVLKDDIGWDKLQEAVVKPFTDVKLAPYYGCTLTRPTEISIDEGISHTIFKEFLEALGATVVEWDDAEVCCGSYEIISNPDTAKKTVSKIIRSAEKRYADALVLSCPLCEYNLGRRQTDMIKAEDDLKPLPTYYFTQLLAIALGLSPEVVRLELNTPEARAWLDENK